MRKEEMKMLVELADEIYKGMRELEAASSPRYEDLARRLWFACNCLASTLGNEF